jgi:hypothetical protein
MPKVIAPPLTRAWSFEEAHAGGLMLVLSTAGMFFIDTNRSLPDFDGTAIRRPGMTPRTELAAEIEGVEPWLAKLKRMKWAMAVAHRLT